MTKDKAPANVPYRPQHNKTSSDELRSTKSRQPLEKELPNKEQQDGTKPQEAKSEKTTRFDGNPNPHAAPNTTFKPKDDTPNRLEKRVGPRDDQ